MLNAMWHGRPVVVADDVSAPDYIADGVDGRVVAAGDAGALRTAILDLWKDPQRCRAMGAAARAKVRSRYTHEHWEQRLFALARELHESAGGE